MDLIRIIYLALTTPMILYLIRHYVFAAITLIYGRNNQPAKENCKRCIHQVSIIIPAHNEESVIGQLLERIANLAYPKEKMQVIVVNDGSSDKTGKIINSYSKKYKFIKAIHTPKAGGKPAALNVALKHATNKLICFFDADYQPDIHFVEKITTKFSDTKIAAVQSNIRVSNTNSPVAKVVSLERIGGYRVDQLARNILDLIPQFGGTAGAVRRDVLDLIGNFDENMLAEDTDLTFRIYLAGYKIHYTLDTGSYEEAVDSWPKYWRQRSRWSKGHMQCAFKHMFQLLKSKNLTLKQKLDGILLLNIYFLPILIGLSWLLTIICLLLGYGLDFRNATLITLIYFAAGNIAPLCEVIVGAILEKRKKLLKYLPLLFLAFILNVLICTKSLLEILVSKILKKKQLKWNKTEHKGTETNHTQATWKSD